MLRTAFLGLSAAFAAGLLFVNIYNSVIDAANWASNIPDSVTIARQYYSAANPGNFYRIASPANQLLALIAVIACWKFGRVKYIALGALGIAVLADLLTFGYFYPRNEIIFLAPMNTNIDNIRLALEQWTSMNWFRSALCTVETILAFSVLAITAKKSAL